MSSGDAPVPITVIGGYLGAGKTTLVNRLLGGSNGRRLGVIVNDFGQLGIDAELLQAAASGDANSAPIVNLANGCVCCTLGDDLRATLGELSALRPRLDEIVIEASGVADPAVAAAWGTVPGFAPGGVVVLAAADTVMRNARDRYVGTEVIRQIEGADLVIVTKSDLCAQEQLDRVGEWIGTHTDAPIVVAAHGDVEVDVVLGGWIGFGRAAGRTSPSAEHDVADGGYVSWSKQFDVAVPDDALAAFVDALPEGVLRMKGFLDVRDRSGRVVPHLVQVVGRTASIIRTDTPGPRGLEVIGIADVLDSAMLDALAETHFHRFS